MSNKLLVACCTLLFCISFVLGIYILSINFDAMEKKIYEEGYFDGMNETRTAFIYQLMKLASECEPIPLTYFDNTTLNLIAYECLKQQVVQQNG